MNKAMTVTYEVDSGLYVNITNRCTNNCSFCIRHNGEGAYGSDSLWLLREPTVEEILESVFSRDLTKYTELVFCGYGEPTERIYELLEVAKRVKEKHPTLKIRVNTNGHADLIHGINTAPLFRGAVDVVSVSLNTSSSDKYIEMCHPVHRERAFPALIEFTKNVKNYVQTVIFSVVREWLTEKEIFECQRIADECGVPLRIRTYVG